MLSYYYPPPRCKGRFASRTSATTQLNPVLVLGTRCAVASYRQPSTSTAYLVSVCHRALEATWILEQRVNQNSESKPWQGPSWDIIGRGAIVSAHPPGRRNQSVPTVFRSAYNLHPSLCHWRSIWRLPTAAPPSASAVCVGRLPQSWDSGVQSSRVMITTLVEANWFPRSGAICTLPSFVPRHPSNPNMGEQPRARASGMMREQGQNRWLGRTTDCTDLVKMNDWPHLKPTPRSFGRLLFPRIVYVPARPPRRGGRGLGTEQSAVSLGFPRRHN